MVIHARIGYDGQEIYGFSLPWKGACPETVRIEGNVRDTRRDQKLAELDGRKEQGIQKTEVKGDRLEISVIPFPADCNFTLWIDADAYTGKDAAVQTDWADAFHAFDTGKIRYRLYSPKDAEAPRPLILFLHGGGESGSDNRAQIYQCFGAARLAQSFPELCAGASGARSNAPAGDAGPDEKYDLCHQRPGNPQCMVPGVPGRGLR